jgi:hypothetical protein
MEKTGVMYSTETIPRINVSKEADAAFMAELKRTDQARYDCLVRNMQKEALRLRRMSQPVATTTIERRCQHCGLVLPSDARADSRYCDSTCQRNARRARQTVRAMPMAA